MSTKSHTVRNVLLTVLLLGAVGGGAYYWFFVRGNVNHTVGSADKALRAGGEAYAAKDFKTAAAKFDEANLLASKALDELDKEIKTAKNQSDEAVGRRLSLLGHAYRIKASALRDQAFAQGEVDGKPLKDTLDTTTGEMFRNYHVIPDLKVREEAIVCLRRAGGILSGETDLQIDALRTELQHEPRLWRNVEQFARNIIAKEPRDARAHYQLALFEFEQPRAARKDGLPDTPERLSRDRVKKARDHLEKSKEGGKYPYWRTVHLEARVARWLRDDYADRGPQQQADREAKTLRTLLLDQSKGVVARAADDKELEKLTVYDLRGVLGMHVMAVELSLEDARRDESTRGAMGVLAGTLELCKRLMTGEAPVGNVQECASTVVAAIALMQPFQEDRSSPEWNATLETAQALCRKALERKALNSPTCAALARVLDREAFAAGRRGEKSRQDQLRDQAAKWVEEGLAKDDKDKKRAALEAIDLHALAAERKALGGAKRAEYAAHLDVLKESRHPRALALVEFLEGAAAEREGRLEKARKHLEAAKPQAEAGMMLNINLLLSNIHLATNQPAKALDCLAAAEVGYAGIDKLSDAEKAWSYQFLRNREELSLMKISAHLGATRQALLDHQRNKPGQPVPAELLAGHEKDVDELRKQIKDRGPRELAVRRALIEFYATTNRAGKARAELALARKDYPESLELLQLEVGLTVKPKDAKNPRAGFDPKSIEQADGLIKEYLASRAADARSRLFWASWLTRTDRADESVRYLQDPANFPFEKGTPYQRALASALIARGDRDAGAKILSTLPGDPAVDLALISLATSPEEREKKIDAALARHERSGLFHFLDAAQELDKGKNLEAAEGFFKVLEYNRLRPQAEAALAVSLKRLAEKDAVLMSDTVGKMLKEAPEQKVLYLARAYAHLLLDEIGNPSDSWERVKTMGSALNVWEQMSLRDGLDRASAAMTRMEYWLQANRPEQARAETVNALAQDPKREAALVANIQLSLNSDDANVLAAAEKHLTTLKEVLPDDSRTWLLQARMEEKRGKEDDAKKTLEALIAKQPAVAEAHRLLVGFLEKKGDKKQPAEAIARWRKNCPDDVTAVQFEIKSLVAGDQANQARALADAFIKERAAKIKEEVEKQKAPLKTSDADWARQKAAHLETVGHSLELEMARGFIAAGALDEAEKRLKELLQRKDDLESARMVLGDVYLHRKAWPQARDVYQAMLKKTPNHFIAGNNLAWILAEQLNDVEGAFRLVQEVRKSRFSQKPLPGDRLPPDFLDTVGVIYHKLNRSDLFDDMRDLFEAARRRYPNDPRMYLFLGHAHAGLKQWQQADEMFATAISLAGAEKRSTLSADQCKQVIDGATAARKNLPGGMKQ